MLTTLMIISPNQGDLRTNATPAGMLDARVAADFAAAAERIEPLARTPRPDWMGRVRAMFHVVGATEHRPA